MASPAPTHLGIDSPEGPLVVSGARPRLSWRLPAGWPGARGYRLEASVDGVELPPVEVPSPEHLFVEWPWQPLASRATVEWRVQCIGGEVDSAWSEPAAFEAGLLDTDWTAAWISPEEEPDTPPTARPAYRLAGDFQLTGTVRRARLYSTALGVYEVFLNGCRVGDAELTPGSTSYTDTLYAQANDVAPLLAPGANRLEVVLSDGWFRGQVGAWRHTARWGQRTAARVEVHLQHPDGTWTTVGTDASWTSRRSEITRADLMDGQTTDLVRGPGPAAPVLVDAVDAPAIDWSPAPPVRRVEQRAAESVRRVAPGVHVVDFGQNASGWVTLTGLGPRGTRTVIDHGEHVGTDGDLTTEHLDSSRPGEAPIPFVQRDEVVSDGEPSSVFEPRHTVHGFRYARVTRDDGADLDPSAITMQVVHTDLRPTGSFTCSDPNLTRLHEVARWSFRGNAVAVPTDCPTRERLGWTGDYQVFVSTAAHLFDVDGFSRAWLRSVRDDQLPDGRIVNSSPDPNRLKASADSTVDFINGSAGWGDAIVHVPWTLHQAYGDRLVLAENWDAMVGWVEFALRTARTQRHPSRVARNVEPLPHEEYLWDGGFHWGEWCEPKQRAADGSLVDPVFSDPVAYFTADKSETATAYLFRSVHTVAAIAGLLGRSEEAQRYAQLAELVRSAWRTEHLGPDGRTTGDSQAGYVRALAFDLIPAELRPAAAARLVELVAAADGHLRTGFLSTADLLPVLADAGHSDVAWTLLTARTSPSWLGMLDRGATTIWEDWDGVDDEGRATASLNHYSKGAVVRYLYSHVLGLRQEHGSTAWERFEVTPVPHPALTWARGTVTSPQGDIAVHWTREGTEFTLTVDVPPGSAAILRLPDGTAREARPGRTTVSCTVREQGPGH